jgi:hypothetical protein
VAASIALIRRRYGCDGFPYTVCPYIDGATIPDGPLEGVWLAARGLCDACMHC